MMAAIARIFLIITLLIFPVSFVLAAVDMPPFSEGDSFFVTRAYNTPATHIGREQYAIDFTKDGCEAFGKSALAALSGKVKAVNVSKRLHPFGLFVLLYHQDGTESRYAHLEQVFTESGEIPAGKMCFGAGIGLLLESGGIPQC